jgi:hypothetical protein
MKRLKTWGGRRYFEYEDSYESKIVIYYGTAFKWKAEVSKKDYETLINEFAGKTVPIGTSLDKPAEGSVGEWIMNNLKTSQIAYCLGAILVEDGYATKNRSEIIFK